MTHGTQDNAIITIPKDILSTLPVAQASGEIIVIDDENKIEEAVKFLSTSPMIGFDTETKPSFKKGHLNKVALVQLSTGKKTYLFRVNQTGFSSFLIQLFENPDILKIGLSLRDDFNNIAKITDFNPQGFIDLQSYVKNFRIIDSSLSKLYAILFDQRISKGQRLTNWEADTLTQAQIQYAALDAQACVEIYKYLEGGNFNPLESKYLTIPSEIDSDNTADENTPI